MFPGWQFLGFPDIFWEVRTSVRAQNSSVPDDMERVQLNEKCIS